MVRKKVRNVVTGIEGVTTGSATSGTIDFIGGEKAWHVLTNLVDEQGRSILMCTNPKFWEFID
ncbi:hypothetical protein J2Y45_003083 [Dyadobacter sp. BE34]|uniref:Uncharacterized protein n=1 Tax=Dyadobacter fermentans TaxID=94254 RepID=A0ABU1QVB1_9BACT|nr:MULTISPECIES: hypothetical protein [Dyadobacter]MDR6804609.1 hypothetical protein [Dyadobacter fermentans]MDR7043632.1 hypothetical protein [Dyadobacter sp. BE242]MDR7197944.1 hypothetical protein [Dyadobacter sp. BE34]MDR7214623.1 hypothetical protein [Dyadobacter sp. BE31]MDR7262158.1 hypothetical protein [Dyadobacter sp. BE32]